MKILKRSFLGGAALALALGFFGPTGAFAATSPTLGDSASYSVLGATTVTNAGSTTINGNVGVSPGTAITGFPPGIVGLPGTTHSNDASAIAAQADNLVVFGALDQGCDHTYPGTQDLTLLSPLAPGVYCADAFTLTGNLALTGTSGVWIFKSSSSLITSPGSSVTGGDPCNVWWRVASSATIETTTSFMGNIFALTSIGLKNGATLNGRALVQTGAVTLDSNTITGPICTVPAASSVPNQGTINVVKVVINDNGGTKTVADFPLFVNGTPVSSGVTNTFPSISGVYSVTETTDPNYTETFTRTYSADCDANGQMNLTPGQNKFCVVVNDDIGAPVVVPPVPPLIDVVKVPSPLVLPDGPGAVTYAYTLRNLGTVPVTDITMVGDTCSPIVLVSGDGNADARLDVGETWTYRCSTTLSETNTNTVVATRWANGLTATDIASATVVVGVPLVPPLIHITKVPSPLTLLAGGGAVTYTKTVTNPGTVALVNVQVTDDKCSPVTLVSGDVNGDAKLDPTETWTYTCRTNLTQTTTNTAVATGEANGMIARDFAIATVVVAAAAPALPKTGFGQAEGVPAWLAVAGGVLAISLLLRVMRKKQTA